MPEMDEQPVVEARLVVEGTPYLLPALDTLNIGEGKVMKRHSGMTLDQVLEVEGIDAGVLGGLLAIAIKRSDPAMTEREIDRMVENVTIFDLMEQLATFAEDVPDPTPAAAPSPEGESRRSRLEPTASSGDNGDNASEPFPETSSPASTGAPISDTPAASDLTTSAA